jgi:hypothetical protein
MLSRMVAHSGFERAVGAWDDLRMAISAQATLPARTLGATMQATTRTTFTVGEAMSLPVPLASIAAFDPDDATTLRLFLEELRTLLVVLEANLDAATATLEGLPFVGFPTGAAAEDTERLLNRGRLVAHVERAAILSTDVLLRVGRALQ